MSSKLLDASTRKPLLEIVETHLLQPHLAQLVEKGFKVVKLMFYCFLYVVCCSLFPVCCCLFSAAGESTTANAV